ncbi:hypothetical protein [Actinomadura rayongensis]|uniref:Helix-turn-helix domain-containing protein n=1 Tax=Actinomadura rayongensis TaxID=1429076 RepID=A0A6I4W0K7_9ACTN|nr:hypothetical protein [Actinomadura rayongensis]MXQ63043.1 hypothetical protein [Actinomadura rayongensis]
MAGGARLCRPCRDGVATALRGLPALYAETGRRLDGTGRRGDRTTGGGLPGLPFNAGAAEIRSAIVALLASWSDLVADQRRVGLPRREVTAMAAFLERHLDWLAGHEAAADFGAEIGRLTRAARRIAYPDRARRVPVGPCVEDDCPGSLVAETRDRAVIVCDTDPAHRWTDDQWVALSGRIGRTGELWLSTGDIARLWNAAPGSIYRMASEQRWRRRSENGRTRYHAEDVDRAFAGRAAHR